MYEIEPLDTTVEPGSNLLISGPSMTGKRELALDTLTDGTTRDEGAIFVTTKDGADRVLELYEQRTPYEGKPVAVVDCVTRQQGVGEIREDDRIEYTSSPVDMTQIGIELSEFLEAFYQQRNIRKNRVALHSLSTLLMYSDLQTVFRFLHVFTGRVQSVDGLGVYVIDSSAHDEQTMNTLKQLFDGVVTTSENAAPQIRLAE